MNNKVDKLIKEVRKYSIKKINTIKKKLDYLKKIGPFQKKFVPIQKKLN